MKIHCPSLCLYFISVQKKKSTYGLDGWNHDRAVLKLLTSAYIRKDRIIECVLSYIGCGGLGEIRDMMAVMEEEELLPF